jgi:hypothetical protein
MVGLVTAQTGAGPVAAGVVAAGAKAVGVIANVVGGVANLVDGNYIGALDSAVSVVAGNAAGELASGALKAGRAFGDLTAQGKRAVAAANSGTSFATQSALKVICIPRD